MASEAVKVVVRCRPLNEREVNLNCKNVIEIVSETGQCSISHPNGKKNPAKNFFFDGAYDLNSTTEQIYNDIGYPLVEGVTEGYNGTIFAYGQTGCGKSFTMQGLADVESQRGVIPRAFDHIFETISVSHSTRFLVHASYLEIYNEEIRDLLARETKTKLELKEHPDKGIYVSGLSMHKVTSVEECNVIMGIGWKNRSTGATLMNADSSRSHSIFTIYLEMIDRDPQIEGEKIKAGKLNLVDLAGSERQAKTGACGDRFKEATKINLSLSALGNVISALVDAKSKHIPYRDSKLTRLLQDSLGGNTKTLMIACLSPADNNYEETLSTLRYANRAKNIQNKPKINEDPKDALLRQYQDEIDRLRQLLEQRQSVDQLPGTNMMTEQKDLQSIEREKEILKQEYESKLQAKEAQYNAEAADKVKLMNEIQNLKAYYESRIQNLDEYVHKETKKSDAHTSMEPEQFSRSNTTVDHETQSVHTPKTSKTASVKEFGFPNTVMIVDADGNILNSEGQNKMLTTQSELTRAGASIQNIRGSESKQSTCSAELPGGNLILETLSREELLKRLKSLESGIVGGELAWNAEARARRSRKLRYAEERKRQLEQANAALEDEGIMVGIYENIQDELHMKNKLLQREKLKNLALKSELSDIQSEFEQDRSDYLDTIRRQQRQIDLLQAIIDRIQPCIRRDSNYHNVDKIKKLSKYDEERNEWILPQMTVERTQLPTAPLDPTHATYRIAQCLGDQNDCFTTSASSNTRLSVSSLLNRDVERETEEEARYYAKLASRTQSQPNYFANRRASQLLIDAAALGAGSHRNNLNSNMSNLHGYLHTDCTGTLPGALDEMMSHIGRRTRKLDSRLRNNTSPSGNHGPNNSPSYRRQK
ncbi:Kinesin protein [Fasciolopsis buskii]|uniref:Kinesin-like protein n=1 Tax=Fasciolopsis buskii TaxID=27845 RepID=A0A8E0S459_9TREM|nr:Kinesin protein [Fasciolopsis buski]